MNKKYYYVTYAIYPDSYTIYNMLSLFRIDEESDLADNIIEIAKSHDNKMPSILSAIELTENEYLKLAKLDCFDKKNNEQA